MLRIECRIKLPQNQRCRATPPQLKVSHLSPDPPVALSSRSQQAGGQGGVSRRAGGGYRGTFGFRKRIALQGGVAATVTPLSYNHTSCYSVQLSLDSRQRYIWHNATWQKYDQGDAMTLSQKCREGFGGQRALARGDSSHPRASFQVRASFLLCPPYEKGNTTLGRQFFAAFWALSLASPLQPSSFSSLWMRKLCLFVRGLEGPTCKPRHAGVLRTHSDTQAVPAFHCLRTFTRAFATRRFLKCTYMLSTNAEERPWNASVFRMCVSTCMSDFKTRVLILNGRLIYYHYWCWRVRGAAPVKTALVRIS